MILSFGSKAELSTVLRGHFVLRHSNPEPKRFSNMFGILFVIGLLVVFYFHNKNKEFYTAARKFPGPKAYPILGNSLDFFSNSRDIFLTLRKFSLKYERFFRVWNNGKLYLICYEHKDAEVVLSSSKELKKIDSYEFLKPWIGNGLISTSDLQIWRSHRKIITPTFHFKILYDFLEVFNRNAQIFCEQLMSKAGKGLFDVTKYAKLMALDNICETAMGVPINAQLNSESEYVKAVETVTNIVCLRFYKVWLMVDFLFNLSTYYKLQKDSLKIIHGNTDRVIRQRREKFVQRKLNDDGDSEKSFYEKEKQAFLDLLLQSEGAKLSDKELREEVDTFMFAGHDTVSFVLSTTFYCLAHHTEVQETAYNEQLAVMGDSDRPPTFAEVQEMKYLEMVLKEVLRLYPSAPIIGRELSQDLELWDGVRVPKGTQLVIDIYALHRDPKVWLDPEKFNPNNFLPEAIQSRNPFSYIPFSAGPRNCLGQKYAMLLLKAAFSLILRRFKILPSLRPEHELKLAHEVTLASISGCNVQIESRK